MTVKTNTKEIAEYRNRPDEHLRVALEKSANPAEIVREGKAELDALAKTGNAYDPQKSPIKIREHDGFGFYAERPNKEPFKSLEKLSINNHSIESELQKIRTFFRDPDIYEQLNRLRKVYTEDSWYKDEDYAYHAQGRVKAPYIDKDYCGAIVAPMKKIYTKICAEGDKSYFGDLAVRMLNGHFGIFDTTAYSPTANAIHSAIMCANDPMDKGKIADLIDGALVYEINTAGFEKTPRDSTIPWMLDGAEDLCTEDHTDTYNEILGNYPSQYQALNDFHYDMAFMFGMQAERWGITQENYNDPEFHEQLATNMERWAKTVYASRALAMLEAQNESGIVLSSDDATFLKNYMNSPDNTFTIEQETAQGLNQFSKIIEQAIKEGHNNADSVLNKGYNLVDEDGESIERKASLQWLEQAQEVGLFDKFTSGKTNADHAADHNIAYALAFR